MESKDIFVSTGAFGGTATTAVQFLFGAGVHNVELSGGKPDVGLRGDLLGLSSQVRMQLHNYFPPPEQPFVFNLASRNGEVRSRTLECMLDALDFSVELGATRYSVHAGFLADPPVSSLGRPWNLSDLAPFGEAQGIFLDSIGTLAEAARERGIEILVENNVLTEKTRQACGDEVLLMASCDQIDEMMALMSEDVGLLLDVAHLNVSAQTLGFDREKALRSLSSYAKGYHLGDNDGVTDSNLAVTEDSWFWPGLGNEATFATLEVAPASDVDFLEQVVLVQELWVDVSRS